MNPVRLQNFLIAYLLESQQLVSHPISRNFEEPEQIFVNRSGTTENTGQENPLERHSDIPGRSEMMICRYRIATVLDNV